jgi:hypothetical protein
MRPLAAIFRPGSCLTIGLSSEHRFWSKPSGIDMGQTLAEKNHTEQSTGALATIVAATYSLELAL